MFNVIDGSARLRKGSRIRAFSSPHAFNSTMVAPVPPSLGEAG